MDIKDFNLINYDNKNTNISININYLLLNDLIPNLEVIFNSTKTEKIVFDLFANYHKEIFGLKKAQSINDYNNVIKKIKSSNPLFKNLKELKEVKNEDYFKKNKEKIFNDFIKTLKEYYKPYMNLIKSHKRYKGIYHIHTLYLSSGLIVGYINPTKQIQTFLVNKKVIAKYEDLQIHLEILPDVVINKPALMYLYDNCNNFDFTPTFKFGSLEEITNFLSICYNQNIIHYNLNNFLVSYDKFVNGEFGIIDNCYGLVQYDISVPAINSEINKIDPKDLKVLNKTLTHDHHYYYDQEFNSAPLLQINQPLNLYQKLALRSAISENTLIYGPPGTGKSEIITNIIANLLDNDKTILFCCEQTAALNVVYDRLHDLRDFCLKVDSFDDYQHFYAQMQKMAINIGNLDELITNQKHISRNIDYTNLNEELKNTVNEYLSFCDLKDYNNYDYKKYLLAYNSANQFIEDNIDLIKEFYNDYKIKYAYLQNEVEFIAKVSQYSIFLNEYNLDDLAVNQLEIYRKQFLDYLVLQNLMSRPFIVYEQLKDNVDKLHQFLVDYGMLKDKQFMLGLNENYGILFENYQVIIKMRELLKNKVNNISDNEINSIINWIISYHKSHDRFMENMKKVNPANHIISIINYYKKGKISNSHKLFTSYYSKKPEKQEKYWAILECISLFRTINFSKNINYLKYVHLNDYKEVFNPITVYFYFNKNLLNPVFVAYYNEKIVCFDQAVLNRFYLNKLNYVDHYLKIVNSYQFEILNKNKYPTVINFDELINYYLKTNQDYILRLNQSIYAKILSQIKQKVSLLNKEQKEKIIQLFKMANNDQEYLDIKEFINHYYHELKVLFPIWILTPNFLTQLTPLEEGIFDVGIIDEASQLLFKKSYPILYRIKQAIICGDPKQLQPKSSNFVLTKLKQQNEQNPVRLEKLDFNNNLSLLDRVKTAYWNTYYLRNHYRSYSHELIDFSNLNYYDNQLIYVSKNHNNISSYEINYVDGNCNNYINVKEVNSAISTLYNILTDSEASIEFKDMLLIVFSEQQAEYILKTIYKSSVKYDVIIKGLKSGKVKIGHLESLQGSEADLVILSTTYSNNSEDLGLLSTEYASNYLNVAITRAKKKMIVISSIDYEIVKDKWDESKNEFLKYLGFCHQLANLKSKKSQVNNSIANINLVNSYKLEFEQKLNEYFKKHKLGYKAVANLNIGSFIIDIAIYAKSINDIDLVIMTNDFKKHLSFDDFLIDLDKYNLLIARNYSVYWVNETDYLKDINNVLNNIVKKLKNK